MSTIHVDCGLPKSNKGQNKDKSTNKGEARTVHVSTNQTCIRINTKQTKTTIITTTILNGVEDKSHPSDSLIWKIKSKTCAGCWQPGSSPSFLFPSLPPTAARQRSQYNQTKQFNALQIDVYLQKSVLLSYYEIFVENKFFKMATKVESDVSPNPPLTSGLNHLSSAIAALRSTAIHADL